jgi:hypothetical protein
MSRTDVHRPWKVQVEDPYNRHRIQFVGTEPWPLYNTCGCSLCVGQHGRKQRRRMERGWWKSQRKLILTGRSERDWCPKFEGTW